MQHASTLRARAPRLRSVVVGIADGSVTIGNFTLVDGGGSVAPAMCERCVAAPGATLVISTTVAGEPPFAYQWLRNGQAIAGAAGVGDSSLLQLTTSVLGSADNGVRYCVVVASAAGSVRSPDTVIDVRDVNRGPAGVGHSVALTGR